MTGISRFLSYKNSKPMKLLAMGLALGVILLLILGSVVWSMYDSTSKMGTHELTLQRLAGNVAHLNELLTMYARLAAATGDSKWERDYQTVQPQLDDDLLEIAVQAREQYEKNYASQTKFAYTKLLEMESRAFALVRQGRHTQAVDILFGREYEMQKAVYSHGIKQMTQAVQTRIAGEISFLGRRIWLTGILGVATATTLLFAWLGISIVVNKHLELRRRAEDELAGEKERLSVTLRSIGEGVITTDLSGKVNLINRVAEELTGWRQEVAIGRSLEEVFVIVDEKTGQRPLEFLNRSFESGPIQVLPGHTILISEHGTELLISGRVTPIRDKNSNIVGLAVVFRDITEWEHMLKEVMKADKIESIGILAGGIAHDFNNILTAILGNISLAKMGVDPGSRIYSILDEAEWASTRAKNLTQQLLTFSKGGAPIKKTTPMETLLEDWVSFALRGSKVKWRLKIEDGLWQAEIDEGQVSQVIHNLIINADQAIPGCGEILVSAENYFHNGSKPLSLAPGKYVKISVSDEGVGIAPENLKRIFDPYFTTKVTGTGMGLASSYSVIKRHGGHIDVNSKVGCGSEFTVFLPASEECVVEQRHLQKIPQKGTGRVLLMDDEPLIRDLAEQVLVHLGYDVRTSKDGLEAIDLYKESKEHGEPFDAVIMDLTIPGGMGGKEALEKLRKLDPHIKAIVSSGYCNDPIMGDFRKYGFAGVLAKPYSAEEMSAILQATIVSTNIGLAKQAASRD
jgi:PAS domain S-box-containing protein